MNKVNKMIATGATLMSLTVATFGAPAMVAADGTGQIETGSGLYMVKNLTTGTAYATTASANACEELQYSVRLHNTGFTAVNNINLKATLPAAASTTNTSNVTATYTDGVETSATGSVAVTLSSAQSVNFEAGTAKLYDGQGNLVKSLDDAVVGNGVDLGSLNGSTTEYITFKAKVNCPPTTPPTTVTTTTPPKPATPAAPTTLVNTGAGDVAAVAAVATAAGAFGYRRFLSRRLSA